MKFFYISIIILLVFLSCTKDKAKPSSFTDENFYKLVSDTNNRIYYQNGAVLSPMGGSPHGPFKLFFNHKAAAVLDAGLELPIGSTFPDSSLLVKEVFNGSSFVLYAFIFKHSGSWTWGEYGPTGNIIYSIGNAGAACIGCHSSAPQRDLVKTFDVH